jgi:hypothetical protein
VKRFLFETAQHTNQRIGHRLAGLLTEIHQVDSTLFDAQAKADAISQQFGIALTINGRVGTP